MAKSKAKAKKLKVVEDVEINMDAPEETNEGIDIFSEDSQEGESVASEVVEDVVSKEDHGEDFGTADLSEGKRIRGHHPITKKPVYR
jgi:NMD protein affecting ribosome stability and mRNA decay